MNENRKTLGLFSLSFSDVILRYPGRGGFLQISSSSRGVNFR